MADQPTDRKPHYRIYILTVWRDGGGQPPPAAPWRYSLENPRTGERHGFKGMPDLLDFLCRQIESRSEDDCEELLGRLQLADEDEFM